MYKILAIIPARSGSKSVPDKNIRLINNKPMLAYSIEHAQKSKYINRIILSTDSERYAEIGRKYGAEVPFIRPAEYATDTALDIDVFYHALSYLKKEEHYVPDLVVQLRPTYPIRNVSDIDKMIEIAINNSEVDSVRSISLAEEIPYKMWTMNESGGLTSLMGNRNFECYNMPRQDLPKVYYQNACIDVIKSSVILEQRSMSGEKIYGYLMEDNFDIDTEEDFKLVSELINIKEGKCTFCFDIDGVIAITKDVTDYSKSMPNKKIISLVNKLYDCGNIITLHTARGYVTGKDWSSVTETQMKEWGVKYNTLLFKKPNATFYVDDHAMTLSMLEKIENEINKEEKC